MGPLRPAGAVLLKEQSRGRRALSCTSASRRNLADFGRRSAYLIDSAGTNSVCVAQLFAANEPLNATGAGGRNSCCRCSMAGNRLCLGAGSPSKDGSGTAIDRETGAPGCQQKRFDANDSGQCHCPGFAVQTTGLLVCGKCTGHRHPHFLWKKSRVHPDREFYHPTERSQPSVQHLRQFCRFSRARGSGGDKRADRFGTER